MPQKRQRDELSEDLVCDICMNVMTNPVVISTGISYDLHCIRMWFAMGHRTCPSTNVVVGIPYAYPDFRMRRICESYLVRMSVSLPTRSNFP